MIERRFLKGGGAAPAVVRARQGDKPGIQGYGAVFNQQYDTGWMIETMKPGAFSRAISEKQDVRSLFNHDPNNLLGRTKNGTLHLSEDSAGLSFDCDINAESRIGADVQSMIARGDLDGCSISFVVRKCTWREESDAAGKTMYYRDIEDVDLYDVGPVTFPAYEQTSVAVRSLDGARLLGQLWPEGVPPEVRSHVPALRKTRRDASGGDAGCTCRCESCRDGDCSGCDCTGDDCASCGNGDCMCGLDGDGERMRMRLRLAELA